jgi:hypothetical protein
MLPNSYEIRSKNRKNEIWERPSELKYCDIIKLCTDQQRKLSSAIITAVAEYTKRTFEVYKMNKTGLIFRFLDFSIPQVFIVNIDNYKLEDNKLILTKGEKDVQ